jgi:hypothetical protein
MALNKLHNGIVFEKAIILLIYYLGDIAVKYGIHRGEDWP